MSKSPNCVVRSTILIRSRKCASHLNRRPSGSLTLRMRACIARNAPARRVRLSRVRRGQTSASCVIRGAPCSTAARPPISTYSTSCSASTAKIGTGWSGSGTAGQHLHPTHVLDRSQPVAWGHRELLADLGAVDVVVTAQREIGFVAAGPQNAHERFDARLVGAVLPTRHDRLLRADRLGERVLAEAG